MKKPQAKNRVIVKSWEVIWHQRSTPQARTVAASSIFAICSSSMYQYFNVSIGTNGVSVSGKET
jgi:hypothetical protein